MDHTLNLLIQKVVCEIEVSSIETLRDTLSCAKQQSILPANNKNVRHTWGMLSIALNDKIKRIESQKS